MALKQQNAATFRKVIQIPVSGKRNGKSTTSNIQSGASVYDTLASSRVESDDGWAGISHLKIRSGTNVLWYQVQDIPRSHDSWKDQAWDTANSKVAVHAAVAKSSKLRLVHNELNGTIRVESKKLCNQGDLIVEERFDHNDVRNIFDLAHCGMHQDGQVFHYQRLAVAFLPATRSTDSKSMFLGLNYCPQRHMKHMIPWEKLRGEANADSGSTVEIKFMVNGHPTSFLEFMLLRWSVVQYGAISRRSFLLPDRRFPTQMDANTFPVPEPAPKGHIDPSAEEFEMFELLQRRLPAVIVLVDQLQVTRHSLALPLHYRDHQTKTAHFGGDLL
eukprot:g31478.t1